MRILTLIFAILAVSVTPLNQIDEKDVKHTIENKNDSLAIEYDIYKNSADSILMSEKTKMTGQMLADAWLETKTNYGVDVPVSLALAQAKLESSYCNSKLSIQKNNPYSLRGSKGYKRFETLSDGVSAYYKLMATRYLSCKNVEQLLKNFVSCAGYRYAGSRDYEHTIKREISIINQKIQ